MFKWDLTPIILLPDIKIDSPRCWGPSCTHLIYLFLCKSSIMRQLIQFAQIFLLLLVFFSSAFHGIFRFLLCSRTMMMMMWIIFCCSVLYLLLFSSIIYSRNCSCYFWHSGNLFFVRNNNAMYIYTRQFNRCSVAQKDFQGR